MATLEGGLAELTGLALGVIGLSLADFEALTPGEFRAVTDSWDEARRCSRRDQWERTRTLAAIVIQPHCRKAINPRHLLPLPWETHTSTDRKGGEPLRAASDGSAEEVPRLSVSERRARMAAVAARLGATV